MTARPGRHATSYDTVLGPQLWRVGEAAPWLDTLCTSPVICRDPRAVVFSKVTKTIVLEDPFLPGMEGSLERSVWSGLFCSSGGILTGSHPDSTPVTPAAQRGHLRLRSGEVLSPKDKSQGTCIWDRCSRCPATRGDARAEDDANAPASGVIRKALRRVPGGSKPDPDSEPRREDGSGPSAASSHRAVPSFLLLLLLFFSFLFPRDKLLL